MAERTYYVEGRITETATRTFRVFAHVTAESPERAAGLLLDAAAEGPGGYPAVSDYSADPAEESATIAWVDRPMTEDVTEEVAR